MRDTRRPDGRPDRVAMAPRRRVRRGWALVAAAAVLLAGMLPGLAPAARAEDLTLRVGAVDQQTGATPVVYGLDQLALFLGYDKLAALGFDGSVSPEFAESWTVSPDGLTWTFKIRPGMKWSDGQPADANDAAFSLNYVLGSIGDKNELMWGLPGTAGWTANGKSLVASATAPDPLTFVITTTVPMPNLLWNNYAVLPEHIWKNVSYADANTTFQAEPPLVGSGPFIETKWTHNQSVELTRNDNYWGRKPALNTILVIYYKSEDAMVQALQAGEIDMVTKLTANSYATLSKDPGIALVDARTPYQSRLLFNTLGTLKTTPAPAGGTKGANTDAVADPAFRDAIGYSIDEPTIVDKVYNGLATPGLGFIAPVDVNYTNGLADITRNFSLAEAARRLDAAGYKLGADGIRTDKAGKPLDLRMPVDTWQPDATIIAQFVVGWLKEIGVPVTAFSPDGGAYWDILQGSRDWELSITSMQALAGPTTGIDEHHPQPPVCESCWTTPEWEALATQQEKAMDAAQSKDLLNQMDRLWYQALPMIIVANTDLLQAHRTDKFAGWTQMLDGKGPMVATNYHAAMYDFFTSLTAIGAATPSPSAASSDAPSAAASAAPSAAAASPAPSAAGGTSGSADSTPLLVGGVVLVLAVVGGLFLRRRRAA